jgi:tetratricopeptide (TPR) repeat protein
VYTVKVNPLLENLFYVTLRRLQAEREQAARVLPALLQSTPYANWHTLQSNPEVRTCGALEYLERRFAEEFYRHAERSHAIAQLAVDVADSLPDNAYPESILAQTRAHAWKDLGKSYRNLGKIPESLDALTRAGQYLDPLLTCAHDRAVVRFNLAVTLQEADRFQESRHHLEESRQVFADHDDTENASNCIFWQAVLFQRMKRYREARKILRGLLDTEAQPPTVAAVHHALGFAAIELGDYDEAESHLEQARLIFGELNLPLNILRVEMGVGRLMVRRGNTAEALILLSHVRRDFLSHQMIEEAGLCALESVDAFLRSNLPEAAESTAREVLHMFTSAGLNNRAISALGYLSEAIAARHGSSIDVRKVAE